MENQEIDRLIAEKVMSFKEDYSTISFLLLNGGFCPSTKIQDAWLVVRKYENLDIAKRKEGFICHINDTAQYGRCIVYTGKAETAPLAICLAALKSVGVPVED